MVANIFVTTSEGDTSVPVVMAISLTVTTKHVLVGAKSFFLQDTSA